MASFEGKSWHAPAQISNSILNIFASEILIYHLLRTEAVVLF